MKNFKKVICLVLSLAMVLGAVGFAFADEEPTKKTVLDVDFKPENFKKAYSVLVGTGFEDFKGGIEDVFTAAGKLAKAETRDAVEEALLAVVDGVQKAALSKYAVIDAFNYPLTVTLFGDLQFNYGVYPYIDAIEEVRMSFAKKLGELNEGFVAELKELIGKMSEEELGKLKKALLAVVERRADHVNNFIGMVAATEEPIALYENFETANYTMVKELIDLFFGLLPKDKQ